MVADVLQADCQDTEVKDGVAALGKYGLNTRFEWLRWCQKGCDEAGEKQPTFTACDKTAPHGKSGPHRVGTDLAIRNSDGYT